MNHIANVKLSKKKMLDERVMAIYMKILRDISGEQLAKLLKKYGFKITRQMGSHMRLTFNSYYLCLIHFF